jgi:tRNA dimethylallyltransferase
VSTYREWARATILDVESRGKRPLFVGGTPMYLKVLLRGLFAGPAADHSLRHALEREADSSGDAVLHARLETLDPAAAARLDRRDRRRIIRALEVIELTGSPLSTLQREHDQPAPPSVPVFALDLPRPALHQRINQRVLRFFESGLVNEVRTLLQAPQPISSTASQAIGYREVIAMLRGDATLESTIKNVQARTRQFAKRQSTWFRGLTEVRAISVDPSEPPGSIIARLFAGGLHLPETSS